MMHVYRGKGWRSYPTQWQCGTRFVKRRAKFNQSQVPLYLGLQHELAVKYSYVPASVWAVGESPCRRLPIFDQYLCQPYCHSHNNWGPWNSFQRFLVPVYYWETVEKPETDPQLLGEWQYLRYSQRSITHSTYLSTWCAWVHINPYLCQPCLRYLQRFHTHFEYMNTY